MATVREMISFGPDPLLIAMTTRGHAMAHRVALKLPEQWSNLL
jgi:hypothetical protein